MALVRLPVASSPFLGLLGRVLRALGSVRFLSVPLARAPRGLFGPVSCVCDAVQQCNVRIDFIARDFFPRGWIIHSTAAYYYYYSSSSYSSHPPGPMTILD